MKLKYYLNLNPRCICRYIMCFDDPKWEYAEGLLDAENRIAFCQNEECPQYNKRFKILPIEVEAIEA